MAWPGSIANLGLIIDTGFAGRTEAVTIPISPGPYTWKIGTGLSPAIAANWRVIPIGAFPINPPGAPSAPTQGVATGDGLTALGAYQWALTNVTPWGNPVGETIPGSTLSVTLTGSNNYVTMTLPAVSQGTNDAPIIARRLYRTGPAGGQLKFVAEIRDLSLTTYTDGLPDVNLSSNAPGSNTSGSIGNVTLSGPSGKVWTERAPGSTLASGDFIVDYSLSSTGGTITFSSADAFPAAGSTPGLTYTAATWVNQNILNDIINALKDMRDALAGAQAANIVITGSLSATGSAAFGGGLNVTGGGATITGNSSVTGTLSVTGTISGPVAATTLSTTSTATVGTSLTVGSTLSVGSGLSVGNGLTVSGGGASVTGGITATGDISTTTRIVATLESHLSNGTYADPGGGAKGLKVSGGLAADTIVSGGNLGVLLNAAGSGQLKVKAGQVTINMNVAAGGNVSGTVNLAPLGFSSYLSSVASTNQLGIVANANIATDILTVWAYNATGGAVNITVTINYIVIGT